MKTLKKSLALIMALAIVMSLGITAFAAETEKGTIVINDANPNVVYNAYRIFDLESHTDDSYSYKVRADKTWNDFATSLSVENEDNKTGVAIKIDNGYITPYYNGLPLTSENNKKWAEGIAAKAKKWIAEHSVEFDGTKTAEADADPTKLVKVEIPDLQAGYYFVNTTLGTVCSLNTVVSPSVNIEEKNAPATVDKVADEAVKSGRSDAQVGDKVPFTVTIHVADGAVGYVLHDTMSDGLVFDRTEEPVVKVNDAAVIANDKTYTVTGNDGDAGFTIEFADDYIATLAGKNIVVTYNGRLTEDAVKHDFSTNTAHVEYGNDPDHKFTTVEKETKTYTYTAEVVKYAEKGGKNIPLAGAEFVLSKSSTITGAEDASNIKFNVDHAGNNYVVAAKDGDALIKTDGTGIFNIKGLDEGTYYLHEITAPTGYNKLTDAVKIIIDHNGKVNGTTDAEFKLNDKSVEGAVAVLNQSGNELPSTGGIGTTVFYVVGALMMVAAAAFLITKKKLAK